MADYRRPLGGNDVRLEAGVASGKLDRPTAGQGRMLAGVCAGLAEHYGFSVTVIRVLFVIFAITGASELAYIILWILMPKRR